MKRGSSHELVSIIIDELIEKEGEFVRGIKNNGISLE